jgi:ActR/RegA family two-component response regulator
VCLTEKVARERQPRGRYLYRDARADSSMQVGVGAAAVLTCVGRLVILLSAYASVETAVNAMKEGALHCEQVV